MLAITRSLGDSEMKDFVSGRPFATSTALLPASDKVLLVACDGLWDVIGDQEACRLASDMVLEQGMSSAQAAEALVDLALDRGSFDNISVIVCRLSL